MAAAAPNPTGKAAPNSSPDKPASTPKVAAIPPVPPAQVAAVPPVAPAEVAAPASPTKPAAVLPGEGPKDTTPPPGGDGGDERGEVDPWARPHFVKGDLNSFSVRPQTRRNFIGVAGGLSALPTDANTVINAFYLTVEPQVEIRNPTYNWRLSLGAPLQFELIDTQGAFEVCVGEAKQLRSEGKGQSDIVSATGTCMLRQKDRVIENLGRLRRADWDEASDFAKVIRHVVVGGKERPFYLSLSRLYDQSFGHGTIVRHYNPNIDYNTARLGANLDFSKSALGVQAMANDLVRPDVIAMMAFVRPLRPYSENIMARSLSFGFSWARGGNQPLGLRYEPALFGDSFNQPIPEVDNNLDLMGSRYHQATIIGFDVETKVVRTELADVKVYADYDRMIDYGSGLTLGSLWRFSFGRPATQALRAKAELMFFGPSFLPNYFDTFHDIFQYQYLPVAYRSSNGLLYHPTKLEFLDASRGGRRRVGAYAEVTHSILDRLTVGAVWRGWTPYGSPLESGFIAPEFKDYGSTCTPTPNGSPDCSGRIRMRKEPGFGSLRLHAELPFRRYLQAFVSYEAFSTTSEGGLGAFGFDGDNEVFFSGARVAVLPFLFLQAEARRYFFLQRLTNVDTEALTFEQDQNLHSRWTFALNASVGYEF